MTAILLFSVSFQNVLAANDFLGPKQVPLIEVEFQAKMEESVSNFLFKMGIGTPGSTYNIYGPRGWLTLARKMNPHIDFTQPLRKDTKFKLMIPIDVFPKVAEFGASAKAEGEFRGVMARNGENVGFKLLFQLMKLPAKQSISTALFNLGIGKPNSKFRIYGKFGFLNFVKALNPQINDWGQLGQGSAILVAYPQEVHGDANIHSETQDSATENNQQAAKVPDVLPEVVLENTPQEASPGSPEVKAETSLPIAKQEEIAEVKPVEKKTESLSIWQRLFGGSSGEKEEEKIVIAPAVQPESSKVDATPVTEPAPPKPLEVSRSQDYSTEILTPLAPRKDLSLFPIEKPVLEAQSRKLRKVNPEVERKAWELSIFDALKPGMEGVFQGISGSTASGYLGARYGYSLAPKAEPLLPKVRFIGVLAELRGGALDGVRLYFDKSPKVVDSIDGATVSLGWQRLLMAYAVKIDLPAFADHMHITPKVGRYTLAATLPVEGATSGSAPKSVNIPGALGAGIEADIEVSKFWYILRGWVAQDFSLASGDRDSVVSRRYGLDLFVKGSGFSVGKSRLSVSYLGFYVNDSIVLNGKLQGENYQVILDNSYFGLGASLSW